MRCALFLFICLVALLSTRIAAQEHDLGYFLARGLANSPLLKDLDNQASAAQVDSSLLKANYKPQVSLTSDNFYPPVINGYGYDAAVTNGGTYSALVNVNQAFIGKKHLQARLSGLHLVQDSFRNERKISEQDLRRTITAQYIVAYGDQKQLEFYDRVRHLLVDEDSILMRLTRSNIYRQSDYLAFMVTFKQQDLQAKQLQVQYQANLATLNYLCGIFDTASCSLSYPSIQLSLPGEADGSVFYRKYVLDSLTLNNNLLLLNYNYRPKLTGYVNAGYNSSLAYQAEKNFGTGIGLNLSLPIYDGHQRKLQAQKIALQQTTLSNYRDFFKTQYDEQIGMLKKQLVDTRSLINDINEQVKYAETLINVNKKFLTTGDVKISDLVIAINNYLAANNLLTQNNITCMQIINQINYWNRQ